MRLKVSKAFIAGITFAATLLLSLNIVSAAPAINQPVDFKQPDGTVIQVTPRGDEWFNWTEDENGFVISFDDTSDSWNYAYISEDQVLPGPQVVGSMISPFSSSAKITADDLQGLMEQAYRPDYLSELEQMIEQEKSQAPARAVAAEPYSFAVNRELLTVLIEFRNVKLIGSDDLWWDRYFDTTPGAKSVANLYKEMSAGYDVFNPVQSDTKTMTVTASSSRTYGSGSSSAVYRNIGCTVVPHPDGGVIKVILDMDHITPTWSSSNADYNKVTACVDLALSAIQQAGFDFSQHMNVALATCFAGGEAASSIKPGQGQVWGHQSTGLNFVVNGTRISRFMIHGEEYVNGLVIGIGVASHELGHVLYLPDLYSYTGDSQGTGPFTLMSGGNWGGSASDPSYVDATGVTKPTQGYTPVHLDAWCKTMLGYVKPTEVDAADLWEQELNCFDPEDPTAYNVLKVTDNSIANNRQYFLVENRQLNGFDSGLWIAISRDQEKYLDGGLLVWHVSHDVTDPGNTERTGGNVTNFNSYGCNSNKNHLGVELEESGGRDYLYGNGFWFYPREAEPNGIKVFYTNSPETSKINPLTYPNTNFHRNGHTATQGGSGNCHPEDVTSNIYIEAVSPSGMTMTVRTGIWVESITVSSEDGTDEITVNGGNLQMMAEVLPVNAMIQDYVWTVDKTSIATIDENGLLTAVWNGIVTVRATATDGSGVYGEFTVRVTGQYTPISVTPAGISTGNKQANVDFAIRSANGKGYTTYISTSPDGPFTAADVNYNSKGAHIKGLKNGTTYYVYIEYLDAKLDIIEKTEILTIKL